MKKSKRINATKREKIFFFITLISVVITIGAIVHAQTGQNHPISEIDFKSGSANGNFNMGGNNIYNVYQGTISFLHIKDSNAQIYQDSTNKEMVFYSNKAGTHTLSDLASISCTTVVSSTVGPGVCVSTSVTCSSGTLVGGGCWTGEISNGDWLACPYRGHIDKSYPSGNTWYCEASTSGADVSIYLKAYAICCS